MKQLLLYSLLPLGHGCVKNADILQKTCVYFKLFILRKALFQICDHAAVHMSANFAVCSSNIKNYFQRPVSPLKQCINLFALQGCLLETVNFSRAY